MNSPGGVTSLLIALPEREPPSSTRRGGMAEPLRDGTAEPLREFRDDVAYADAPLGSGGALEKLSVLDLPRVRLLEDCRTLSLTSWLRPRRAADKLNFLPRSSLDSRLFGPARAGPGRMVPLARLVE